MQRIAAGVVVIVFVNWALLWEGSRIGAAGGGFGPGAPPPKNQPPPRNQALPKMGGKLPSDPADVPGEPKAERKGEPPLDRNEPNDPDGPQPPVVGRRVGQPLRMFGMPADDATFQKRLDSGMAAAMEWLLARQRNKVLIYQSPQAGVGGRAMAGMGAPIEVEAAWKDVFVDANNAVVRIKGQIYANVIAVMPPGNFEPERSDFHYGADTCMATLALLAAGADPARDPRIAQAVEAVTFFLTRETPTNGGLVTGSTHTYIGGLRTSALEAALRKTNPGVDRKIILTALKVESDAFSQGFVAKGGYTYPYRGRSGSQGLQVSWWDMSNTQYGLLALWAASRAGMEISDRVWNHFNEFLLNTQEDDGGWGYNKILGQPKPPPIRLPNGQFQERSPSTETMTSAGLAGLLMVSDILHTRSRGGRGPDVSPLRAQPLVLRTLEALERGLERFGRGFGGTTDGYYNYGVERVGVAAGYKRFGKWDWFREGAESLLAEQLRDGSWLGRGWGGGFAAGVDAGLTGSLRETCWNLLYLAHGNAPVLVNKLKHSTSSKVRGDVDAKWGWHNYPRDAAGLADWWGRTYETSVNWQIVDIDTPDPADFRDAPVLYIGGHRPLDLTEQHIARLRDTIESGGTLLFVAYGNSRPFAESAVEVVAKIYPPEQYPERQMTTLPLSHSVRAMSRQDNAASRALDKLPILHASDGARSFAFLVLRDVSWAWHARKAATESYAFQLFANVQKYATDSSPPPTGRVRKPITADEGRARAESGPAIRVGRLRFASEGTVLMVDKPAINYEKEPREVAVQSDWSIHPQAWPLFASWFTHVSGRKLDYVHGVSLTDTPTTALAKFDVLHLTGRLPVKFTQAEEQILSEYLNNGGRLIVNPVGNDAGFVKSVRVLLERIVPGGLAKFTPLGESSVLTGVGALRSVGKPNASRQLLLTRPELRDPATVVLVRTRSAGDANPGVKASPMVSVLFSPVEFTFGMSSVPCWERMGYDFASSRVMIANVLMDGSVPMPSPSRTEMMPSTPSAMPSPANNETAPPAPSKP